MMQHRPSSLPALAKCAGFSPEVNPYFAEGTKRHEIFAQLLASPMSDWDFLAYQADSEETAEGLKWAASHVLSHANEIKSVEKKIQWPDPLKASRMREGTPDVIAKGQIFDLKWRDIDCFHQMADYALGVMANQQCDHVVVDVLFAAERRYDRHEFSYVEARSVVAEVLASIELGKLAAGGQCSRCAKQFGCPEMARLATAIVKVNPEWNIEPPPLEFVAKSKPLGTMLKAADAISDWCEKVRSHCKKMAVESGIMPEGFEVKMRKGNRKISEMAALVSVAGLPSNDVLNAAKISITDAVELYAKQNSIPKAGAEKELVTKLESANAIQRGPDVVLLTETKTKKTTN